MSHTLHIIGLDPAQTIRAVKGVRAARKALNDPLGATLRNSKDCVDAFKAGQPALVGQSDDYGAIGAAAATLEIESENAVKAGIDADPEVLAAAFSNYVTDSTGDDAPDPDPDPDEDTLPSYEACKTALVLMAVSQGDPSMALSVARTLGHAADDERFYNFVAKALQDTFPPRGPQGPNVPVVVVK